MKKILVTGGNGQVGSSFQYITSNLNYCIFSKSELDITDSEQVRKILRDQSYDAVVNCAAYTAVDKAEVEIALCSLINHIAVDTLSKCTAELNIPFIHLSSDYVYHPAHNNIMSEDHPTNPQGVYASSKLAGETAALKNNAKTCVIRTSWVYNRLGKNFVNTMLRLMQERESLSIVNDQIGSPTYAVHLAEAIDSLLRYNVNSIRGIYNYSNTGFVSWYDFALAIRDFKNLNCELNAIPTSEYPTAAQRPLNSRLSKDKIATLDNIKLYDWKTTLQKVLSNH